MRPITLRSVTFPSMTFAPCTVAFPAENLYIVCRVSDTGVELLGRIDAGEFSWDGSVRGLSIDDAFYVVAPDAVTVLSFETMKKLATVPLN